MNKIKTVSFYVARILDCMIMALPIYIILRWIFTDAALLLPYEIMQSDQITWTPLSQIIASSAQVIGIIPLLGILYFLSQVFHRYEVGAIFTLTNAQSYYKIGILLFFDALLAQPISGGLWTLATTLSNPVGQRYINITIGTPNIMALLMGLLVILISWVMIEGSKIQDEQQLTI